MQPIQVSGCTVVLFQGLRTTCNLGVYHVSFSLKTFSSEYIMLVVWLCHFIRHEIVYMILAQIGLYMYVKRRIVVLLIHSYSRL